jgi:hypothetical protein
MKKIILTLGCGLWAFGSYAAGTYYTGGYQSPQTNRYAPQQQGSSPFYTNTQQQQRGGGYYAPVASPYSPYQRPGQQPQPPKELSASNSKFTLGGGITHEVANYQFSMKETGSILEWHDIGWNVLDLNGAYKFGISENMKMSIDAGLKFGFQSGNSKMTDDDITNGGMFVTNLTNDVTGEHLGSVYNTAMSIGTSSGGSMLSIHLGLGLPDLWKWGNARVTPSIGYRHLSYKLKTSKNHGISIMTGYCYTRPGTDEIQCDPLVTVDTTGNGVIDEAIWGEDNHINDGYVYTDHTYEYYQPGTSHSYDVAWSGPFIAMDFDYDINEFNSVGARAELGLPSYKATGDQPYRLDWKHPNGVEDSAGFGKAYHLGLTGTWTTSLTDSLSLQLGFSYDYYTMKGATAKTNFSGRAYGVFGYPDGTPLETIYWDIVDNYFGGDEAMALDPVYGDERAIEIYEFDQNCPGWVCTQSNEVDAFYRSMGIRIGLSAKF